MAMAIYIEQVLTEMMDRRREGKFFIHFGFRIL